MPHCALTLHPELFNFYRFYLVAMSHRKQHTQTQEPSKTGFHWNKKNIFSLTTVRVFPLTQNKECCCGTDHSRHWHTAQLEDEDMETQVCAPRSWHRGEGAAGHHSSQGRRLSSRPLHMPWHFTCVQAHSLQEQEEKEALTCSFSCQT